MKNEQSAGIIFFRKIQGEVNFLLLNYPSGHWDLVKGHIENNEKPKEAAIRESNEETGITDINFIDGFEEEIDFQMKHLERKLYQQMSHLS